MSRRSDVRTVLDVTASVLMIVAAVALLLGALRRLSIPAAVAGTADAANPGRVVEDIEFNHLTTSIEDANTIGSRNARLVVIEFSDFQCPFCGKYSRETFPRIKAEFIDTGTIAYAFMHFPLSQIHPAAVKAAEAATCAGRQRHFWEMHDLLFANQQSLGFPSLLQLGHEMRLDESEFTACINAGSKPCSRNRSKEDG